MIWVKIKKFQRNIKQFGKVLKKEIETIIAGKKVEYGKYFFKTRFESNKDFPLNKPIKLRLLTIIIKSVFSADGKFYPQLFLDDALYELA